MRSVRGWGGASLSWVGRPLLRGRLLSSRGGTWADLLAGAGAGRGGCLALHVRRRRAASDVLAPRNDVGPVRSVRGRALPNGSYGS